jgi:amino acid adenylation domain-containing protein
MDRESVQRLRDSATAVSADSAHDLLIEERNDQNCHSADEYCVHHLFEEQVRRTPDAVAVMFEDSMLTYRELNLWANKLAHYLLRLGVQPEVLVGICMERCLEMVVAMLGILKTGGGYVPLDPQYPRERLTLVLADTDSTVLLTQKRVLDRAPRVEGHTIVVDEVWDRLPRYSEVNPCSQVRPESLAYVIHTSGSTGSPKGVMVEHRSLASFSEMARVEYGLGADDRVLQFASISVDTSAEEIFPCLTQGAVLVLRNGSMIASVASFVDQCREWDLTVLDLPTAYWHELTRSLSAEHRQLAETLRLVILGGEQVLSEKWKKWHDCIGGQVELINTYGPTETTVVATKCRLEYPSHREAVLPEVPIGVPFPKAHTYVLDQHHQLLPRRSCGELHLSGTGLARGYLNKPDLTAEKFIPNPFSKQPGTRLYRTGDKVRYLPDGNLKFMGRADDQVKVRGYRIELGEINAALMLHPNVSQAVVLAVEISEGDRKLVAYVVPHPGTASPTSELRHYLRKQLPDYMVPATYLFLDAIPLTPGGKVDRRALPLPGKPGGESSLPSKGTALLEMRLSKISDELLKSP